MKTKSNFLLAIACFLFVCTINAQSTYYVSPSGNNTNPGTLSQPFKRIQKAINVASSGDTINVMAGTYTQNLIMNSTSNITLQSYNDDVVIVDGGGTSANSGDALLSITDVDDITVDGFIFQNIINLWVKGVIINKNCNNITISNNIIRDVHFSNDPNESVEYAENANPLLVYSTDPANPVTNVQFLNNEIYNCRTGYSESMTVNGNTDGFLLEGNYIHDVANIGIDIAGHFGACPDPAFDQARNGIVRNNVLHNCASNVATAGSIYVDGGKNVIIENNLVYDGQVGIAIGCENPGKTADNITVRNNVTYNNTVTGIEIGGYDYPTVSGTVTNSQIYGNTTYKNDTEGHWVGELWINHCSNLTVKNNLFYADNANKVIYYYAGSNGTGNVIDYNLYNTPTGKDDTLFSYDDEGYGTFDYFKAQTGVDLNSTFADPLFVNAAMHDFHIANNSPAKDAGDPSYTGTGEVDMDNEARIFNSIVDCGADENYSTLNTLEFNIESFKFYPNPTTDVIQVPATLNDSTYKVYSVTGQLQMDGVISNETINLSALKNSIYFISIENKNEGKTYNVKVIKN